MEAPAAGSYEEFVGLWLNIPRVRMQQAYIGGVGVQIGTSTGSLPEEYGDALALTEGEALETVWKVNAERKSARVLASL